MRAWLTLCVIIVSNFSSVSLWATESQSLSSLSSGPLTWDKFWKNVASQSNAIQALEAQKRSVESEIVQELPPPMITAGSMGENGPFSRSMETTIGITQKVPFPIKFIKASNVKSARVDIADSEKNLETKRLKEKTAALFIALYGTLQEKNLLGEKRKIFVNHLKTLKSITISSQLQQIHISEITSEIKLIDNELIEIEFEERRVRLELASILGQEQPVSFIPELPRDLPTVTVVGEKGTRIEWQLAQNQEALYSAEQGLARQAWTPDLVFSFTNRNRLDGVMPKSQEFMVGLEFPFLWGWQPARANQRATALLEKSHYQALQAQTNTKNETEIEKQKLKLLWNQWTTLTTEVIPASEKRVHLLHRITPSDMETLDLHRNTLAQFVDLKLKALKLEQSYRLLASELAIREEYSK